MPEQQPTLREWEDYLTALNAYVVAMINYVSEYKDGGENPTPPRPFKPPQFSGWAGE